MCNQNALVYKQIQEKINLVFGVDALISSTNGTTVLVHFTYKSFDLCVYEAGKSMFRVLASRPGTEAGDTVYSLDGGLVACLQGYKKAIDREVVPNTKMRILEGLVSFIDRVVTVLRSWK